LKNFIYKHNKDLIALAFLALNNISYFGTHLFDIERIVVECPLDSKIPLIEGFILPYVIWYVSVPAYVCFALYLCHKDKKYNEDYYRYIIFVLGGVFVTLVCFWAIPTTINFRPKTVEGNTIFTWMLNIIYSADKPINVFPSGHCYAAMSCAIGMMKHKFFKGKKYRLCFDAFHVILAVLICLSTVFIKQHSILDFFASLILIFIMYPIAYKVDYKFLKKVS